VLLGTFPFNASGSGYKVDLADTSASGKVVADAIYYVQDGAPVDSFTWTPDIQSAGDYQLYARWTASSANSGAAQYTVVHDGGTSLVTVSQKQNGGQWNLLGTWNFAPSAGHQVTLTASSDGAVVADAIKLVGTGPAPANLVYLHTDQIGLPQKITDATQAVVWDRVQDPFGRQVSLTNSGGIDTVLRFPGQQADPDTGFAYNYFRDYDPTLGRYIQADPIGLAGGINRYAYVGGNPVGYTDLYGLDTLLVGLVGTVTVAGGVDASGGLAVDLQDFRTGFFGSFGPSVGANVSADAFVGWVFGDLCAVPGRTINWNLSIFFISITGMFTTDGPGQSIGDFLGFTVGIGPGFPAPVMGSATRSDTDLTQLKHQTGSLLPTLDSCACK
jgi:RHS repeat-associated protein